MGLGAVELEHLVSADAEDPLRVESKVHSRHSALVSQQVSHSRHAVKVLFKDELLHNIQTIVFVFNLRVLA